MSQPSEYPDPTDPTPRSSSLSLGLIDGARVIASDDEFSDRLRCDHPTVPCGEVLAEALIETAGELGRGRIVVLGHERLEPGLTAAGFAVEARIPGFYQGEAACTVAGLALRPDRAELANPLEVQRVHDLIGEGPRSGRQEIAETMRATTADADDIARLIAETFDEYPTPSGHPGYVAGQIEDGTPFRLVRSGDDVVACASADLCVEARTAELTDCATRPDHRGRGLMQAVLGDLMEDLRAMDYPTAFTLARARIPGVNLAFERLGFALRGTMTQSCRIGGGLEDMHVWSRAL